MNVGFSCEFERRVPCAGMVSEGSQHILAVFEAKRELLGMSKAELARRMDIDAVTMGTMLRGKRSMMADEALRLCACLDVEPAELMSPETRALRASYWRRSGRG